MGARLMRIEGEVQRSKEGVVHLMARRVFDHSALLARLVDPEGGAGVPRASSPRSGHPRRARILPGSRDFR